MPKALIIAYSFPPVGGGRVQRVLKFVKYLRLYGWEPVVLTVKKPKVPVYDRDLINDIPPDVKIIRSFSLEPPRWIINSLKADSGASLQKGHRLKRQFYKIGNRLKWWLFFPDLRVGWVPFCVFYGWRAIKREKIDLIYANGEPFSSFIAAVILKKITRRPLLLDFRDEWHTVAEHYFPEKARLINKLEKITEGFVVRNADKVVSVNEAVIKNFIHNHKSEKKEKFACITNGFDPEDFQGLSSNKNQKFTITYAGVLYRYRTPQYFLEAVKKVSLAEPGFLNNVRILFIGMIDKDILDLIARYDLGRAVEITGFLPFRKTVELMSASDLLLYIEDQVGMFERLLPAKIFEYMATGKPTLALASGGCLKGLVEYTGCGISISSFDVAGIAGQLRNYYQKFKKGEALFKPDMRRVMEFSRRNTTKKLAEEFSSLLNGKIY